MTRPVALIGVVVVLFAACAPAPGVRDDEVVESAAALVGRWRAIGSAETRVFLGDGTTWIESAAADGSGPPRQSGTYRLVSPGELEIQIDGASTERWTVTVSHVTGTVLKLRDAGGHTLGYVDASTIPAYAPTTSTGTP